MTVDEYSAKFDMLSHFALHLIPTEEGKGGKFKHGLCSAIKAKFVTERIKTMEGLLDRVNLTEEFWNQRK